jgi:Plasmid pRiA4b ORF-3-like protein
MSDRLFAMFARLPSVGEALALRVTLRHIEPAIWRTLVVPAETSLGELHEVLQIVFGWHNSHLHDFEVGGIRLGMADVEDDMFVVDEQAAPLGAVAGEGTSFTYRYDFGDDWRPRRGRRRRGRQRSGRLRVPGWRARVPTRRLRRPAWLRQSTARACRSRAR